MPKGIMVRVKHYHTPGQIALYLVCG